MPVSPMNVGTRSRWLVTARHSVPPGNDGFEKWIDVYKKILAAGKGAYMPIKYNQLDLAMEELQPEGSFLLFWAPTVEAAEDAMKKMKSWK